MAPHARSQRRQAKLRPWVSGLPIIRHPFILSHCVSVTIQGSSNQMRYPQRPFQLKKPFTIALPLCLILVTGCGKPQFPLGQVRGRLTLDGQPVVNADIWFRPVAGGRPSFGKSDQAGSYSMRYNARRMGALPGEHIVTLSTFQEAYQPDEGADDGKDAAVRESTPGRAEEIPAKYFKNRMKFIVEEGSNTIDLTLDSTK